MRIPDLLLPVISKIDSLLSSPPARTRPLVLGIDGKCGAGKTTLAGCLDSMYHTQIVHLDDFFLPLSLRSEERLKEPGGNIHYERLLQEVIVPLQQNSPSVTYRRFDCSVMQYADELKHLSPKPGSLILLEGSYSMRPEFRPLYSLSIYADISDSLQRERILKRNGEAALQSFLDRWIPMENYYFSYYQVKEACDFVLELNGLL